MSLYVTRCLLEVNGQSIEDFSSFTETSRDIHIQVNKMNSTGHAKLTERYSCNVTYVVPQEKPEFDWAGLSDGTLTVEYDSGARVTFSGVYVLSIGDATVNGESESTREISLGAEGRTEE